MLLISHIIFTNVYMSPAYIQVIQSVKYPKSLIHLSTPYSYSAPLGYQTSRNKTKQYFIWGLTTTNRKQLLNISSHEYNVIMLVQVLIIVNNVAQKQYDEFQFSSWEWQSVTQYPKMIAPIFLSMDKASEV